MKKVIGFYIDEKVIKEFKKYCEKEGYRKAGLIEALIKIFLKRVKNGKKN